MEIEASVKQVWDKLYQEALRVQNARVISPFIDAGGVAAAMAADDAEEAGSGSEWDGLILLASYPTKELSTPVISIYGSEDRVLDSDKYSSTEKEGLWPDDFTEMIIEGGNHAQFGNYGEQKGDGTASISAKEQQRQTAELIKSGNNWR